jgi:valyl-tRNA synthetase
LDTLLVLFAPIIPLFTHYVYASRHAKDVHHESYPTPHDAHPVDFTGEELMALNSLIWKAKRESGGNLKTPLKSATLPTEFSSIERDLKGAHSIQSLAWGAGPKLEL